MPDALTLLLLGLGAFRLTILITTDVVLEPLRTRIWRKWPPDTYFGYFWTCNWCAGTWVAGLFTFLWFMAPDFLVMVSLFLAISAVIGLLSDNLKY